MLENNLFNVSLISKIKGAKLGINLNWLMFWLIEGVNKIHQL